VFRVRPRLGLRRQPTVADWRLPKAMPVTLTEREWNIRLGADTRAANDLVGVVENGGKARPALTSLGFL
jgi:hypothetical protein